MVPMLLLGQDIKDPVSMTSGCVDGKLLQILDSLTLQPHTHPFFHCFSLQFLFIKCDRWSVPLMKE
jgi:hypothetical protein